jgi:hypothetical protein
LLASACAAGAMLWSVDMKKMRLLVRKLGGISNKDDLFTVMALQW